MFINIQYSILSNIDILNKETILFVFIFDKGTKNSYYILFSSVF